MTRRLLPALVFPLMIFSVAWAEEIRYDSGHRRDPFVPLADQSGFEREGDLGKSGLGIEGIVFDPKGGSYAVINEKILREGQSINQTKLIRIEKDRLIFVQEGEEKIVWLREEIAQQET